MVKKSKKSSEYVLAQSGGRLFEVIRNPETGRNVSIYGKIGKNILRNYISVLQGGASECTNYHSDPIKCQASKDESGKYCVYAAAKTKGVVGQCKKSTAKDVEKSKEKARRGSLEKKFQESAALRLQRRFRNKKRIDNFTNAAEDMQRNVVKPKIYGSEWGALPTDEELGIYEDDDEEEIDYAEMARIDEEFREQELIEEYGSLEAAQEAFESYEEDRIDQSFYPW